jgi:enterochelin esterase family protein
MTTAIYQLASQPQLDADTIDAFIESHSFPIVEDTCVTFIYRGEADAVFLQHWIYGLPPSQPFTRMRDSDLWFLIQEVPEGSRIEYKLDVILRGKHESILDPLNPNRGEDPSGAISILHAKGYDIPDWTQPDPEAREGFLEEITVPSEALGEERRLSVYIPARYRKTRRYPLLVAFEGQNFLRFSSLKTVLDNLIHRLEIAPMMVALCPREDRLEDTADDPDHARFIAEELVPLLEKRYPIDPRAWAHGLLGASFSATAALATAWRYPEVFRRLLLQSCSFALAKTTEQDRHSAVDPVWQFVNRFRDQTGPPAERVFLSCGVYESRIYQNRALLPLLQAARVEVRYVEPKDGHNWGNWRDRLREGLSWLYPGPLWMVYE